MPSWKRLSLPTTSPMRLITVAWESCSPMYSARRSAWASNCTTAKSGYPLWQARTAGNVTKCSPPRRINFVLLSTMLRQAASIISSASETFPKGSSRSPRSARRISSKERSRKGLYVSRPTEASRMRLGAIRVPGRKLVVPSKGAPTNTREASSGSARLPRKCGAFPRQAPRWAKKSAAISLSPFRGLGDDLLYEAGQLKGSVMNSLSIIPRRDAVEVGRYLERIPPLRTERKAPQAAGIRRYRRKVQPAHGKNGAYGRKRLFDQVAIKKRRFGLRDEDSVIRQGFVAGDIEVSTEKSNRGAHGLGGVDDDHVVRALVLLNVADAVGKHALDARI